MASLWDVETQDFPENPYSDERYEQLVALELRIMLHAEDPQTWSDIRHEITQHIEEGRKLFRNGAARFLSTEWNEHFCTLWEMRRWLERRRVQCPAS